MNDHSGLRYLFDQPNMNYVQAIWLATLSEFGFETIYIKGKENMVVGHLQDHILHAGQHDDKYKELKDNLQ